jgi:hypothetical protein
LPFSAHAFLLADHPNGRYCFQKFVGESVNRTSLTDSSPALSTVIVQIGDIPVSFRPSDPDFCEAIQKRYVGFLNSRLAPACRFEVHITAPANGRDDDTRVSRKGSVWRLQRGDFQAEWDRQTKNGWIRQCANPYSIDTVLRITHSLILATEGGFLVHAASAIRNGRSYLFAGISGAGKTTLTRCAPSDVTVLTDEISYVRRSGSTYRAYGTPFAGELARSGENTSAPVDTLFLLEKGPNNRIETISAKDAAQALMRHILFFAHESELVERVFDSVLEFVSVVKVRRLVFTPDERAWRCVE